MSGNRPRMGPRRPPGSIRHSGSRICRGFGRMFRPLPVPVHGSRARAVHVVCLVFAPKSDIITDHYVFLHFCFSINRSKKTFLSFIVFA